MTKKVEDLSRLLSESDGCKHPSPLDQHLIKLGGDWEMVWVPYCDHYPIELVDETDEISGDEQLVRLWVPKNWSQDEAIDLLMSYV